jgi:archaellum biogenesis ATPase FlaH
MRETTVEIYPFEPSIELAIALACSSDPRFWSIVGHALDPERLKSTDCKLIVQAVKAFAAATGGGPSRPDIVVQRLVNMKDDGKLSEDHLSAAKDYLMEADLSGAIMAEELAAVVVPIVKRVHYKEAVAATTAAFGKDGNPEDAARLLEKVSQIGLRSTTSLGSSLDQVVNRPGFIKAPADAKAMSGTGIQELDDAIGGGMERRALGLLVGGSGAGKSMALSHITAHSLLDGRDTVLITLELGEDAQTRRLVRNLVDMTSMEMHLAPTLWGERLKLLKENGLGRLMVAYMEPIVTSPRDIRALVNNYCRNNPGFTPSTFVIDFLDKIRCNQKASLYEDMLAVTDGLRSIAVESDGWVWTASQSDRKSTTRPWLDIDAVADSMNKIRSADVVIGIGRTDEDKTNNMVRFSVPKRREGEGAHTRVGPIPWDPEHGRITIINRIYPW